MAQAHLDRVFKQKKEIDGVGNWEDPFIELLHQSSYKWIRMFVSNKLLVRIESFPLYLIDFPLVVLQSKITEVYDKSQSYVLGLFPRKIGIVLIQIFR